MKAAISPFKSWPKKCHALLFATAWQCCVKKQTISFSKVEFHWYFQCFVFRKRGMAEK